MMRALTLCSLLLLPMSACDDAAFNLVESADRPSAIPDPPDAPLVPTCEFYCADYRLACDSHFGYASVSECEALCGYWEADKDFDCRFAVLDEIADGAVEVLEAGCAAAGPYSEECGSGYVITCDRYCDELRTVCTEDGTFEASFESREECQAWCDEEPLFGDDKSIECRLGAMESLAAAPDCEAAAPDNGCK